MDIIDCDKKCKDCGEKFPFRGNFRSINKRKFCDKCKKAHRSKPLPDDIIPVPKPEPIAKIVKAKPKETRIPIGQRKCCGCEGMALIYSNRGKRKIYCKDCKITRAKLNHENYLRKYVENNYDTS